LKENHTDCPVSGQVEFKRQALPVLKAKRDRAPKSRSLLARVDVAVLGIERNPVSNTKPILIYTSSNVPALDFAHGAGLKEPASIFPENERNHCRLTLNKI